MELQVKKQIIGALAVVFILLVLFPFLFNATGYKERHLSSIIPPRPEVTTFKNIQPLLKPLPSTQQIAPVKTRPKPVAVQAGQEVAEIDQQGVPVAWTLQLASFKDAANARSLRKQLLKAGHKVYSRQNGALVKVYVGPELKKQRLQALKKGLKDQFGLDGLLVRFTTQ